MSQNKFDYSKIEKERMIAALACIGDGIITVNNYGLIDYMNEAAEKLTAWNYADAAGYHIDQVLSLIDGYTLEPVKTPMEETVHIGKTTSLKRNTILLNRDGIKMNISASCSPIFDRNNAITGVVVAFRDITRIRNMEEQIENERNNLKLTFSSLSSGTILLDNQTVIQQANNVLLEMLNGDFGEVFNQKIGDGLRCSRSYENGCGNSMDCSICEIRRLIRKVLETGMPCNNIILQHTFMVNGKEESPWFKINFVPVVISNTKYVMMIIDDITDIKKREEQLIRAKDFTLKLFDNFPLMAWRTDPLGNCDFLNHTWLDYTGLSLKEGLGTGFYVVFHPEDREPLRRTLHSSISARKPYTIEHRMRFRNGDYRWVVSTGTPYYDLDDQFAGFIGSVYDVNDRKMVEQSLKESEEKYKQLFDSATDVIILHELSEDNKSSRIVDANKAACVSLGYSKEELLGLKLHDIQSEISKESIDEAYEKILNRYNYVYETLHVTKDGKEIPFEVNDKYFVLHGKNVILSICRDLTDRMHSQNIMKKAKEEAEAANRAKSEFLANMSHEIRTPINGINGMIDLTLMADINEEQKSNLLTAKKCAESLLNIINNILDFSKMEAGKFRIINTSFNLYSLVEDIFKIHQVRAIEKGLNLVYKFEKGIEQYLKGDPNRIQQVLNNLINNAIKFTDYGEVALFITKISQQKNSIGLQFEIKDTGIGISKDNLNKLFRSFSQIDSSFTKKHGGTGLGLIISKQLVEMMGGRIWVTSEEGKGSSFFFVLNFDITEEKEVTSTRINSYVSKNSYKILIAEDDIINQTYLSRMLAKKGHNVTVANDGVEAVRAYLQNSFDIILMDIQMPEMNGVEALHEIRSYENERGHIPVIALTAFALLGDRDRLINLGMDDYIAKPIKIDDLLLLMDKAVISPSSEIDYNERPFINENGELEFIPQNMSKPITEISSILYQADSLINQLNYMIISDNYNDMEEMVHDLKELFNRIDEQELKDITFKTELAARKGNISEIKMNFNLLLNTYNTLKKSWE